MKDVDICKCEKASITYDIVGEDRWYAKVKNSTIEKDGFAKVVICKSCKDKYSRFDPCMVPEVEHIK